MSAPTLASCRNLLAEDIQAYTAEIQRLRKNEADLKKKSKEKDAEIARILAVLAQMKEDRKTTILVDKTDVEFQYDQTFKAISAAVNIPYPGAVGISVDAFQKAFNEYQRKS